MQIMKPKFLLTVDGFTFNREEYNILQNLPEIVAGKQLQKKCEYVYKRYINCCANKFLHMYSPVSMCGKGNEIKSSLIRTLFNEKRKQASLLSCR